MGFSICYLCALLLIQFLPTESLSTNSPAKITNVTMPMRMLPLPSQPPPQPALTPLNVTSPPETSSVATRTGNVTRVVVRKLAKRGDGLLRKESVRVETLQSLSSSASSLRSEKESMEALQSMILGGKPGVDFPNYARPPRTKFSCKKMQFGGMFADPETGCQAYHVCHNRRKDTFMCPTGTLFNQQIMSCDFWYNVNCETATQFYDMNVQLYHPYQSPRRTAVTQPTVSFPVQTTRRPSNPPPAPAPPPVRPNVNRSDRPIIIPMNPIPSTTIRRPVYDAPAPLPTTPIHMRPTPPPTTTTNRPTTTSTSTTTSRTTSSTTSRETPVTSSTTPTPETPRTRKATTPRSRVNPRRTTRPPPPGIEVDDRDWVFAWIKQGNGTRADKSLLKEQEDPVAPNAAIIIPGNNKMPLDHFPLFNFDSGSNVKKRTETAFSFHQDVSSGVRSSSTSPSSSSPARSSAVSAFNFKVIPSSSITFRDSPSSAVSLEDDSNTRLKPYILIKKRDNELRGESVVHPNPWFFPLEHESSQ